MHAGGICGERYRSRLLRTDFHGYTIVGDCETMGQVIDIIDISDDNSDFITLF